MISKLPTIVKSKELTEFTFGLILEYIEIWDDCFQVCLANSIVKLYDVEMLNINNGKKTAKEKSEKEMYQIDKEKDEYYSTVQDSMTNLINPLIKFCMKIISTEVTNVNFIKLNLDK